MAADAEKLGAQGARLKELRARKRTTDEGKRLTQEAIAAIIGVTVRAYQEWETGRGDIKPENLEALADYYGTSPDWIEYGEVRLNGGTPDLSANLEPDKTQLDRIEALINDLIDRLVAAKVIRAVEQDAATGPPQAPSKRRKGEA